MVSDSRFKEDEFGSAVLVVDVVARPVVLQHWPHNVVLLGAEVTALIFLVKILCFEVVSWEEIVGNVDHGPVAANELNS